MTSTEYQYICLQCDQVYPGSALANSFRLQCDRCGDSALLEAEYPLPTGPAQQASGSGPQRMLRFDPQDVGFFRYRNWLPMHRTLSQASLPTVWRSRGLAAELGLEDLDILFSGYAPALGADIRSTTFKEFEAYSVLSYTHGCCRKDQVLVVASAGNTARAFAEVAQRENLAVLLVVPDVSLEKIKLTQPPSGKVVFVASTHKYDQRPSEYAEAIALAQILCQSEHFFPEGGVKNIARRDGLGVGYLHAQYTRWSQYPSAEPYRYYFQAIGSGTGALGSYSMYRRLKKAGCIAPQHQLSLMLAQNAPFIPVVEHWQQQRTDFQPYLPEDSLRRNEEITAHVLANRNPPYAVAGGLAGVLRQSQGRAFAASNAEILAMQQLLAQKEGIDIMPAAAVAAAALRQAVRSGLVSRRDPILLHLTGGGQQQLERDFPHSRRAAAACTADLADLLHSPQQQRRLIGEVEQQFGF